MSNTNIGLSGSSASKRLANEYKKIITDPVDNVTFDVDENNILNWKFTFLGPYDTPYEGGIYHGVITFPPDYPSRPPKVKFTSKLFHPNVYPDGNICISILHEGIDETNYEREDERWRSIFNVRYIFIVIIAILNESNLDSAANIDAAKLYREDKKAYYQKIRKDME